MVAPDSALVKIAASLIQPPKRKLAPKSVPGSLFDPTDHGLVTWTAPTVSAACATSTPLRYKFQFAPSKVPARKTQLPMSLSGIAYLALLNATPSEVAPTS